MYCLWICFAQCWNLSKLLTSKEFNYQPRNILVMKLYRVIDNIKSFLTIQEPLKLDFSIRSYGLLKFGQTSLRQPISATISELKKFISQDSWSLRLKFINMIEEILNFTKKKNHSIWGSTSRDMSFQSSQN